MSDLLTGTPEFWEALCQTGSHPGASTGFFCVARKLAIASAAWLPPENSVSWTEGRIAAQVFVVEPPESWVGIICGVVSRGGCLRTQARNQSVGLCHDVIGWAQAKCAL